MKKILYVILLTTIILPSQIQAQKQDAKGSEDYRLLNRMPDYYIRKYSVDEFNSHEFIIDRKGSKRVIEGKKFFIRYEIQPKTEVASELQIIRNYTNAIKENGGTVIYESNEFATYSFTSEGKEIWMAIITAPDRGRRYTLLAVEKDLMNQEIVIKADKIKENLDSNGKIAFYGIFFDSGKAIVKDESKPTLNEIADFLKSNLSINCWIVGHTDTDGTYDFNMQLSLQRAEAVKNYLENIYGINSTRLSSKGVGSLSPVATNSTKAGKKLNRRVELVKK